MGLLKVIFLFVIFVAHKASSVLLTCCTRKTNENGKKNSLFIKSCFATSCTNHLAYIYICMKCMQYLS